MVKKWRQEIRAQQRGIDRQIRAIDTEEIKNCKMLAKELIRSQRHKDRLYTSKAQMNSIIMHVRTPTSYSKVAGSLQKSGEVMKLVNQLSRLPEISQTMQQMSMEMTKAGLMEEMIGDTMDMMDDDDIEKLQMKKCMLGEAGSVGATLESRPAVEEPESESEEEGPELDMMQNALKG
ncbi:hypothetical protein EDC96DRAFT_532520 [Choanephora cucurbitarum]|nr:hypothetical protein EDC96DRAFT_532520 [Choanephora cucurbitarum]